MDDQIKVSLDDLRLVLSAFGTIDQTQEQFDAWDRLSTLITAQAEVDRLMAEIRDRESERADMRDRLDEVAKAVKAVQKAAHLYGSPGGCTTAWSESQACNVYDVFEKQFRDIGFIEDEEDDA